MINNQFEEMVMDDKKWDEALENEPWIAPLIDIYETSDDFMLIANMPGVSKENVKVNLEEGSLVIKGKVDMEAVASNKYVVKETESGNYYRRLNLGDSIDIGAINAQIENGQLKVNLPKHERVKPRKIEIK